MLKLHRAHESIEASGGEGARRDCPDEMPLELMRRLHSWSHWRTGFAGVTDQAVSRIRVEASTNMAEAAMDRAGDVLLEDCLKQLRQRSMLASRRPVPALSKGPIRPILGLATGNWPAMANRLKSPAQGGSFSGERRWRRPIHALAPLDRSGWRRLDPFSTRSLAGTPCTGKTHAAIALGSASGLPGVVLDGGPLVQLVEASGGSESDCSGAGPLSASDRGRTRLHSQEGASSFQGGPRALRKQPHCW